MLPPKGSNPNEEDFSGQEAGEFGVEKGDEAGGHEVVFVGDVEADDAFAVEVLAETAGEAGAVGFFHDEDRVGPLDGLGG